MNWPEAIGSVALAFIAAAIVAAIGLLIGWLFGVPEIGVTIGAFAGILGWVLLSAYLSTQGIEP